MEYEQTKADPCVFRKVDRKVTVIFVVSIDEVLISSKKKADEEEFISELGSKLKIKERCTFWDAITPATEAGRYPGRVCLPALI